MLYFVLYHDLENSVTPSPGSASASDRQLEPWVFALCRDCIESSKVIILTLAQQFHQSTNGVDAHTPFSPLDSHAVSRDDLSSPKNGYATWTDIQLLVGSYAVLLSVQNATSFSSAFRDIASIDEILDMAERVLSWVTSSSLGYARTLEILANIRHNFRVSTPGTVASC